MTSSVKKYIIPVMLLTVIQFQITAQTTTNDKNVTVEREYKPVIQDAGKINQTPQTVELRAAVSSIAPSALVQRTVWARCSAL